MRISDWSSDVCSSDLYLGGLEAEGQAIFDEVLAGKHDDGAAYRIARVYRVAGEKEKARVIFERYLAANPDDSRALSEVGAYTLLDGDRDRKSTRLNSSHYCASRMPSSASKTQLPTDTDNTAQH